MTREQLLDEAVREAMLTAPFTLSQLRRGVVTPGSTKAAVDLICAKYALLYAKHQAKLRRA